MAEPRIQYAKTTDGVSIAFYTMGEGTPLVWMPMVPATHLEFEWRTSGFRQAYETVSSSNKLIRYDCRGFGLSDRDVSDLSVDAMVRDLEAVADHLGLGKFQLLTLGWEGSVAIAYAAVIRSRSHTSFSGMPLCEGLTSLSSSLT